MATYTMHYFKMIHHLKRNSLFTFNYTEPTQQKEHHNSKTSNSLREKYKYFT